MLTEADKPLTVPLPTLDVALVPSLLRRAMRDDVYKTHLVVDDIRQHHRGPVSATATSISLLELSSRQGV